MKIKLLSLVLINAAVSSAAWAEGVTTQQTPESEQAGFYQSTINQLNQSSDGDQATKLSIDWAKYVSFNGGLYVDAKAGDQTYETEGENSNRLSVTNAHLTVNGKPNSWTNLTIVSNYSGASSTYIPNPDEAGTNSNNSNIDNPLYVDQAYATFGDESRYPVFAQVGKQYLPFGQYTINPIIKSLGQILTETNATDAQVGFAVPEGLYGSAYTFENPVNATGSNKDTYPYNGGVVLGFKKNNEDLKFDLGMGYMNNMSGVNSIANYIDQEAAQSGYVSSVSALAPYFSFQTGPFGINLDYVTALSRFDKSALAYDLNSVDGAKPSAFDLQTSYAFNRYNMNHVLFVGYQVSDQASALDIPKKRYVSGYTIYPLTNFMIEAEIARNTNYEANHLAGNTADGQDYFTYTLRVGVQF